MSFPVDIPGSVKYGHHVLFHNSADDTYLVIHENGTVGMSAERSMSFELIPDLDVDSGTIFPQQANPVLGAWPSQRFHLLADDTYLVYTPAGPSVDCAGTPRTTLKTQATKGEAWTFYTASSYMNPVMYTNIVGLRDKGRTDPVQLYYCGDNMVMIAQSAATGATHATFDLILRCDDDKDCDSEDMCDDGVCVAVPRVGPGAPCTDDVRCVDGYKCFEGKCEDEDCVEDPGDACIDDCCGEMECIGGACAISVTTCGESDDVCDTSKDCCDKFRCTLGKKCQHAWWLYVGIGAIVLGLFVLFAGLLFFYRYFRRRATAPK